MIRYDPLAEVSIRLHHQQVRAEAERYRLARRAGIDVGWRVPGTSAVRRAAVLASSRITAYLQTIPRRPATGGFTTTGR